MPTPTFVTDVLRPLDLLVLRFEFHNLVLEAGPAPPRLVRERPDEDSFIVVQFPPQHVAEPGTTGFGKEDLPFRAGLSGPTRLVFRLPPGVLDVPYTLADLLQWTQWEPSVVPAALPPGGVVREPPPLRRPATGTEGAAPETAIELPYRLILSPHAGSAWAHSIAPVTYGSRTEAWHTRLGVRDGRFPGVDEHEFRQRAVRAVWTRDWDSQEEFSTPLERPAREQIVTSSADFNAKTNDGAPYLPLPVDIDRLMLSAQGGWLRARGQWDPPRDAGLAQWQHVATQGRDHYVRTDRVGFLYPFGHRAVITTITERLIIQPDQSLPQAVLWKKVFLTVQDAVKVYDGARYPHRGLEMPLTEVRLATLTTAVDSSQASSDGYFWVRNERDDPVSFHLVGRDRAGAEVAVDAALIFVPKEVLDRHPEVLYDIREYYAGRAGASGDLRRVVSRGQQMAFAAPRDQSRPGDTSLITDELYFDGHVDPARAGNSRDAPFVPLLQTAKVRVPALREIVGTGATVDVALSQAYLDHGFDGANGNAGQVFVEIKSYVPVEFSRQGPGALVTPNFTAKGLSRHLGAVGGDLTRLAQGGFSPGDFFTGEGTHAPSRLLGAIPLASLVEASFHEAQFPKVIRRVVGTSAVATLDWEPRLSQNPADLEPLEPRPPGISLAMHSEIRQPLDGGAATATSTTTLRNFTFNFASVAGTDVVKVHFESLAFINETGRKPDVSAVLAAPGLEFGGPLAFLNDLRRFIPLDGFHDPPALDVTSAGINVGYSLALPPLTVGVFALQNVRLGAALNLPFTDGKVRLRLAFSEQHQPFLLTVSGLGGGGFFGLAVGLDGIEVIEAALEFGAAVALNLGVASGGVHIMAGVYFRYAVATGDTELTGYLRCGGALQVLGLICVSVEFYMALSYITGPERVEGQATLTVKISLLFFSKSVHLTVRRSFAQSSGASSIAGVREGADYGVTFGDLVSAAEWEDYAEAFA